MIFDPSIYVYVFRIRSAPMSLLNDFKYVYVLIRFDYVLDSNYTKGFSYDRFNDKRVYVYMKIFEPIYLLKRVFQ